MILKRCFNQHASCRARETVNGPEFREITLLLLIVLLLILLPLRSQACPVGFVKDFAAVSASLSSSDCFSSGFGNRSGRSTVTPKTFCGRSKRETGRASPILLATIIKTNGVTIARACWNGCAKFCAICAVFELTRPTQLCGSIVSADIGTPKSSLTATKAKGWLWSKNASIPSRRRLNSSGAVSLPSRGIGSWCGLFRAL